MKMLIWLMVLHFVADFILQSREMGQKKSSEISWLLKHLLIQFGVMFAGITPVLLLRYVDAAANNALIAAYPAYVFVIAACISASMFSLINTLVHGLIDWNIWKAYKLYAYRKIKAEARRNQGCEPSEEAVAMYARDFQYWNDHWFYTTIG